MKEGAARVTSWRKIMTTALVRARTSDMMADWRGIGAIEGPSTFHVASTKCRYPLMFLRVVRYFGPDEFCIQRTPLFCTIIKYMPLLEDDWRVGCNDWQRYGKSWRRRLPVGHVLLDVESS